MRRWKQEVENNAGKEIICYLVGNRADLGDSDEREVSLGEGQELMRELAIDNHMETSALTGSNINELFETITKHLYLENSNKLQIQADGTDYDNSRT